MLTRLQSFAESQMLRGVASAPGGAAESPAASLLAASIAAASGAETAEVEASGPRREGPSFDPPGCTCWPLLVLVLVLGSPAMRS